MTEFAVSEVFDSIQGEGALTGTPSTFIRLAFCNLACSWCDAAYTWKGKVESEKVTLDRLVKQAAFKHVVLTGGEPTYAGGFVDLVKALHLRGHHVTVETNGTIWHDDAIPYVDLWSVSPKLGSSEQRGRLMLSVLRNYAMLPPATTQFKFVIDGEDDFAQTVSFLRELQLSDTFGHRVLMQPNGLCHNVAVYALTKNDDDFVRFVHGPLLTDMTSSRAATTDGGLDGVELETPYLDRLRWLYERIILAEAEGELPVTVRAVPQAHKLAWGNRRGF